MYTPINSNQAEYYCRQSGMPIEFEGGRKIITNGTTEVSFSNKLDSLKIFNFIQNYVLPHRSLIKTPRQTRG